MYDMFIHFLWLKWKVMLMGCFFAIVAWSIWDAERAIRKAKAGLGAQEDKRDRW